MRSPSPLVGVLLSIGLAVAAGLPAQTGTAPTAQPIFDGRTLDGWRGDERLWSVEDGAIRGSTTAHRAEANTFLIWEGGDVADFELTFEAKFTPANNSGVQYRSRLLDGAPFRVAGNQCDMHPSPNYLAMLYSERDRGILAERGQKVVIDRETGKPRVVGTTNPATPVDVSEWHRYRIVARGDHLVHQVDGVTSVDVRDEGPSAPRSGILALQLHAGPPMEVWFRDLRLTRFAPATEPAGPEVEAPLPHWIWFGPSDGAQAAFRRTFELRGDVERATIHATADNHCEVWLNGVKVLANDEWGSPTRVKVDDTLRTGTNVLAVHARNDGGPAAVALRLWARHADGSDSYVISDGSWRATVAPDRRWQSADFDASAWRAATDIGPVGGAGLPWSPAVGATAFGGRPQPAVPQPVRATALDVLPGFVAELVYEVPLASQGSWVSLANGDRGRLIASDQGGKGLYRITPAAVGVAGATTSVEPIDVDLDGAQGLLWAFDSLYAMVNGKGSGLYRVTDSDDDDQLDTVQLLRPLAGAGEHGPHAILLAPERDALIVCAGNHTNPPEVDASRIPTNWAEDLLLPRQWDARGHARGRMAPGGWISRVAPDGSRWEMLSIGYRNEYDIALNRSGDLFTYDADMEWDMGMPWYRPTRICHATSGSEFGWRAGTGKWPTDYPDSLPPTLEIGPGSPTGITFGYGAAFPTAYQEALYALDWTFGTIWAIHLDKSGASYTARHEEFVSGKPLALTDAVVGDDGALYFVVGGRGTQSMLYRVRYTGDASTAAPGPVVRTAAESLRRELERFHGKVDPQAVELCWPALGHPDRFVAYAARIAIEAQPVAEWRSRALAERSTVAARNALLALARQGTAEDRDLILRAVLGFDLAAQDDLGAVALLRVMGVAMARHGAPGFALRVALVSALDPVLPTGRSRVDNELVKVLAFLGSPTVVEKAVPMMVAARPSAAPGWSEVIERNDSYGGPIKKMIADMPPLEGIDLAFALRNVRFGWTLPLRRQYFEFINRAARHPGGASYAGFLTNCRNDALANCSVSERAACADLTGEELAAQPDFEITPPQGPGREWTIDDAVAAIAEDSGKRDFAAGRNLFHAVACAACHRFDGAGGDVGPDLTTVANKFSPRDLLTSILEPSRVISDQFGSSNVTRKDGTMVFGRAVERADGSLVVYPMDPSIAPVRVPAADIGSVEASPISQMPVGLVYSLNPDELRDLIAYLLSLGDENAPAYRR